METIAGTATKFATEKRAVYITDDGVTASYLLFLAGISVHFERRPMKEMTKPAENPQPVSTGFPNWGFSRDTNAVDWKHDQTEPLSEESVSSQQFMSKSWLVAHAILKLYARAAGKLAQIVQD